MSNPWEAAAKPDMCKSGLIRRLQWVGWTTMIQVSQWQQRQPEPERVLILTEGTWDWKSTYSDGRQSRRLMTTKYTETPRLPERRSLGPEGRVRSGSKVLDSEKKCFPECQKSWNPKEGEQTLKIQNSWIHYLLKNIPRDGWPTTWHWSDYRKPLPGDFIRICLKTEQNWKLPKNHDTRLVKYWNDFYGVHMLGSVCAKYASTWSEFWKIIEVTRCTLDSFIQYVQAGVGLHKGQQLM